MVIKQKDGIITRSDQSKSKQTAASLLASIKNKTRKMVIIAIDDKTSIELPADLSSEELKQRISNYIIRHKVKMAK